MKAKEDERSVNKFLVAEKSKLCEIYWWICSDKHNLVEKKKKENVHNHGFVTMSLSWKDSPSSGKTDFSNKARVPEKKVILKVF